MSHVDYQLLDKERLGIYLMDENSFYIQHLKTKKLQVHHLNEFIGGETSIAPVAFNWFPFLFKQNRLSLICCYKDIMLDDQAALKEYFARPNTIHFSFEDSSSTYTRSGFFPANYRAGNSYKDPYPYFCYNDKDELVYSYQANDSLFVYSFNGSFKEKHLAQSQFAKPFMPFDLDKLMDMAYTRNYATTQNYYGKVIFDPYRNCYYRFFKKEVPYLNAAGKIRSGKEIPWTLLVLDENFRQKKEYEFDPAIHTWDYIVPVKEGVYIGRHIENNELILDLVQL